MVAELPLEVSHELPGSFVGCQSAFTLPAAFASQVQYSMEKVAYDKAGYMTEAKSAMQARSLTNLQSSSVGSVVTSEPEEQVAAPTATTMNEAGRISAAFRAWYPLYLPLGLALL